ncbi:MAG: YraN family protein [Clostridia bacterium]|nr:YraN family protein [Clostridia bacterium]
MMFNSGKTGEAAATKYLKVKGYKIIDRNYRKTYGELDIVAQKGENIAFVEVKTRKSDSYGTPAEFVTLKKQKKLIKAAYTYIQEHNLDAEFTFDVVEVYIEGKKVKDINHIKNAFYVSE